MNEHQFKRLLSSLFVVGKIKSIQYEPLRYIIALDDDRESKPLLPLVSLASDNISYAPLSVGEQVFAIVTPDVGYVVGSLYQTAHPQPQVKPGVFFKQFSDDTFIKYDTNTKKLDFDCAGEVTGKARGGFFLEADVTFKGQFKLEGLFDHTGDQQTSGKIESQGDQVADGISQIEHKHKGVSSGTATSGEPV